MWMWVSWRSWKLMYLSSIIMLARCESNVDKTVETDEIAKLPHCIAEDIGYVLVSTLDGKLSALRANGEFAWEVDTGGGPLLQSSIHNVELTNQGELVRIIPSLSGSLYKFNGKTIDVIPINADALLKSSFVYSSETVIAGRREVRTYGIVARTGNMLYECSSEGCRNITQTADDFDDIIVIERSTATVRAHEPRTGQERWNFSVGYHNIKIPPASCINLDSALTSLNITAVLPDGVISASRKATYEHLWTYEFETPIVKIWKWDGRDLYAVDIFANSPGRAMDQFVLTMAPAIYLGMHNQQLYIHESIHMLSALQKYSYGHGGTEVSETKSWTSFPWKPVPAGSIQDEVDDATAISVLYSSNYVNGNGYYFYTEEDRKKTIFCDSVHNGTGKFFNRFESGSIIKTVVVTIGFVFATVLITQLRTIYNWFSFRRKQSLESFSKLIETESVSSHFDSVGTDVSVVTNDARPPQSHFLENFEIISQLGKGGYGIVFEVKQKIDNSNYAVKIIPLPQRPFAKERVLREVVALARLDHPNIVRYSTSWNEDCLPDFTSASLDLIADTSLFNTDIYDDDETADDTDGTEDIDEDVAKISIEDSDDSFIVFNNDLYDNSCTKNNSNQSRSTRITLQTQRSFGNSCSYSVTRSRSPHNSISIDDSDSDIPNINSNLKPNASRNIECKKTSKRKMEEKDTERRYLFIQMQLCDKMTLKDWMKGRKERQRAEIYAIYKQILQAVEYIHSKQLIHRDLKPSNIFFNADSTPAQIKVGDFGLVTPMQNADGSRNKILQGTKWGHTRDAGTALYMSPEQKSASNYNYKVDVFSLGVILFELLVYFGTEGERIDMLIKLRAGKFPEMFQDKNPQEYALLQSMLSSKAEKRPTVREVMEQIVSFHKA